jgi:hypothetical protein
MEKKQRNQEKIFLKGKNVYLRKRSFNYQLPMIPDLREGRLGG